VLAQVVEHLSSKHKALSSKEIRKYIVKEDINGIDVQVQKEI
jgi:hypothetical protein